MTAGALLREVSEAGFHVRLVDGRLRLDYDHAPPPTLVERLRAERDDLTAILSAAHRLRAERDAVYACSGVTWPEDASSNPVSFTDLVQLLADYGIRFSRHGRHLVRWSQVRTPRDLITQIAAHHDAISFAIGDWSLDEDDDPATPIADPEFWEQLSLERNEAAAARGQTVRYCSCQLVATLAVFDRDFPEQQRWLCDACFESGAPFQRPLVRIRRQQSPQENKSPGAMTIDRPLEPPRDQWWEGPVAGWERGQVTISNMASDETVMVNLNEDDR